MNIIERIKSNFKNRGLYVTLDPNDNSVTFSPKLYKLLKPKMNDKAKVIVVRVCNAVVDNPDDNCTIYGFIINPSIGQETQLADVQYNSKHDCYGFETLVPTVNLIFNDNNLPAFKPQIFKVVPSESSIDTCYLLIPPKKN